MEGGDGDLDVYTNQPPTDANAGHDTSDDVRNHEPSDGGFF